VELQTGNEAEVRGLLAELVRVDGELRNDPDWRGLPYLSLLTPEGNRFVVQWETFLTPEQARFPGTGAKVQLTGILRSLGAGTAPEDAPVFAVVPRTFRDVRVLRSPSWWTRPRLVAAAGWLAVVAGLGLGATLVSRWQIRRQRKAVREAEARAIAMEERNRIARELHDSLQQHLAGAALHVETLQGAASTVPQMVPQLLDETAAMIRHCQMEARHCIWDLRSSVPGSEDLAAALEAWLRMKASQLNSTGLGFQREGEMPMLGREKAFQVLRIVQEAVNNAVAHAGAKQITVRMKGDEGGLQITVTDDGCGFDVNTALVRRRAHFGLLSQRERSARIKGGLEFDSQLQRGTRVTLRVGADSSSPP
jgi:signal transduction histidine kinase